MSDSISQLDNAKQHVGSAAHSFRVLNVNDSAAHRALIGQILTRSGMTIVDATDGTDALNQLAPDLDVVVLDVNLPESNGVEICHQIKKEYDPFLPVLLISAASTATVNRVQGLERGADGYLTLPVEPRELVATVNSLGRLRRAERSSILQSRVAVLTAETAVAMTGDLPLEAVLSGYANAIVNRLGIDTAAVWINDDGVLRLATTAGDAARSEGALHGEFRLPPTLRNGIRQGGGGGFRTNAVDVRQLVDVQWLENQNLSWAKNYLLPGHDGVAGIAALFATRPVSAEILDLLAASADSVALGIERKRFKSALTQSEEASARDALRIQQLESELARLERIATGAVPAASQTFGARPLSESHPGEFSAAVTDFTRWLTHALDERSHKVDHGISEGLRQLADRLARWRVGPRDVIEIYTAALKATTGSTTGRKDHAYVEEGRLLVLELMGNLVSHYRTWSLASSPERVRLRRPEPSEEVKRDG